MEHSKMQPEKDPSLAFSLSGEHVYAPASLLLKLEDRLALYNRIRSSSISRGDLLAASHHEQWEIRSAAVEALVIDGGEDTYKIVLGALQDKNCFVRMTAVRTLGMHGNQPHLSLLLTALQDDNWQVREMAVLTLRESIPANTREMLLHDSNSNVRDAIRMVIQTAQASEARHTPLFGLSSIIHPINKQRNTREKRSKLDMATITQSENTSSRSRRTFPWKWQIVLIASSLAFLVILTAASVISGWWNPQFGDPNLYQTIGRRQTSQGITIEVTKVYADQGRTIIAYDLSSQNPAQSLNVIAYDLTSATPQNHEILTTTQCDAPQNGVRHCYMIQPSFQVANSVHTLDLDWNVTQVAQDSQRSVISGTWHFSFSVPFHHENRQSLPNPIHGGQKL